MSKLDNVVDLSQLSSVTDDFIVACLRERFLKDSTYTRVGSSAIVAVNPHKYVSSNSDTVLVSYAHEYRDTSATKIYKEPHVFQLANNAYYNMRRTGQDQCILLMLVAFPRSPQLPDATAQTRLGSRPYAVSFVPMEARVAIYSPHPFVGPRAARIRRATAMH